MFEIQTVSSEIFSPKFGSYRTLFRFCVFNDDHTAPPVGAHRCNTSQNTDLEWNNSKIKNCINACFWIILFKKDGYYFEFSPNKYYNSEILSFSESFKI